MAASPTTTITNKTMTGISNVVKILPTTTVFAFQVLNPSFSNRGQCLTANKYLTVSLIILCSISSAFFSITDSVVHKGKFYFGVATLKGFHVFNFYDDGSWLKESTRRMYRLKITDGVRVVFIVLVFLALAFCDANVQVCFFPSASENQKQLLKNLPLGLGFLAAMVFMLVPHTRKGIGYADDSKDRMESDKEPLRRREEVRPPWTYAEHKLESYVCVTID